MILAGDIGGTKTVLALFEETAGTLRVVRDATFASQEHPRFEEILSAFFAVDRPAALRAGCFGVAGAVIDGRVHGTNLQWTFDEETLAAAIRAPRVKLLNDLEAAAYGVLFLREDEVSIINTGAPSPRKGNVAVIAAGTGLGEAFLYWDGTHYHPVASEGGHVDFAPRSNEQIDLLGYLRAKFNDHVSYERVLSGPGFYNVYSFLRDTHFAAEPTWLRDKLRSGDPSAIISEVGLAGGDPLCVKTLDLFSEIYGAEAGNLALKCLAVGGVFVAGGIGPKMLPVLKNGSFMRGFREKGRFAEMMNKLPVRVAMNPRAPLLGAAHYALRL